MAHGNKDTILNGNNKPENNVKLRLGIHEFEVQLGKVLKDRVATKYYIENNQRKHHYIPDAILQIYQDNEQNVIITQIVIHL
ncbi:hypothetical protein HYE19_02345 [Mycoplasmopsis bovis]|nr:hypothetical protein [Mycoplasmopsis bovis]QQH24856.1 hypothetical protein HYE19_02345 [Mycoplasmopsis bovis]